MKETRATLSEQVFVEVQRAATGLAYEVEKTLKARGLSEKQYNVLRILRGAGDAGIPCGEICGRMISRDPDVTRLLDRLEKRGLVARSRSDADRRVNIARITAEGRAITASLDVPIAETHSRLLGHLKKKRLRRVLELVRELLQTG